MKDFSAEPFKLFNNQWALVTAGKPDNFNTMTISWGEMGTLWSKPTITVFVKQNRYTFNFMENNDYFTVSFFDKEYRDDLKILGTKSGRDGDKVAMSKLEPVQIGESTTFKQAQTTFLCRKIYADDFDVSKVPNDVRDMFYKDEPPHRMYIGQIIDTL